jgi:hypothetical protein
MDSVGQRELSDNTSTGFNPMRCLRKNALHLLYLHSDGSHRRSVSSSDCTSDAGREKVQECRQCSPFGRSRSYCDHANPTEIAVSAPGCFMRYRTACETMRRCRGTGAAGTAPERMRQFVLSRMVKVQPYFRARNSRAHMQVRVERPSWTEGKRGELHVLRHPGLVISRPECAGNSEACPDPCLIQHENRVKSQTDSGAWPSAFSFHLQFRPIKITSIMARIFMEV